MKTSLFLLALIVTSFMPHLLHAQSDAEIDALTAENWRRARLEYPRLSDPKDAFTLAVQTEINTWLSAPSTPRTDEVVGSMTFELDCARTVARNWGLAPATVTTQTKMKNDRPKSDASLTPPPPGSPPSAWHEYENAVAAKNQKELAAKQEEARVAAAQAQAERERAYAAYQNKQKEDFEKRMRAIQNQQAQFRDQQEQEAFTRWLQLQNELMQKKLQQRP